MTDKLSDTTPLVGISDDTESRGNADAADRKESFGSVLLNTATGQEGEGEHNPDADDGTTDSSQA